jgi:hypothetical protein
MTDEKIMGLVNELNSEAYDRNAPWIEEHGHPWTFHTDGCASGVDLLGTCIWDTESDDRPYDGDEQQPLGAYLREAAASMARNLLQAVTPEDENLIGVGKITFNIRDKGDETMQWVKINTTLTASLLRGCTTAEEAAARFEELVAQAGRMQKPDNTAAEIARRARALRDYVNPEAPELFSIVADLAELVARIAPNATISAGRVLPHSPEDEAKVCAGIMANPAIADVVGGIVEAADFYSPRTREIFRAMMGLFTAGKPIDLITVEEQLRRDGDLAAVGGMQWIASQIEAFNRFRGDEADIVARSARIVRDKATLRKLIKDANEVVAEASG